MELGDHNKLDKLESDIYNRSFPEISAGPRSELSEKNVEVKEQWSHSDLKIPEPKAPTRSKWLKKVLIGSLIFFFLALGTAAFIFYRGLNIVSTDNIVVSFLGPASIGAGQELDFDVVVQNKNKLPLIDTKIYIDYPDGTKQLDLTQDLLHETETLGDIEANGSNRRTIKAVLFGKEHDSKVIKVTVEYSVKNSNAVFRKEAVYNVTISSVPIVMTIDSPQTTVSGDQFETTVTLTSNSSVNLSNILLQAAYPFGYTFLSSIPVPQYDTSSWLIKTLKPGQTITYTIRGRLEGQEQDSRAIRFTLGAQNPNNPKEIGTEFLTDIVAMAISKPQIQADLSLNGNSSESNPTIQVGSTRARITLTNTTPNVITNAQVQVGLSGSALNAGSIVVDTGSYNQQTKTITWNQNLLPTLASIQPGGTVVIDFNFSTLSPEQVAALQNASIIFSISSSGTSYGSTATQPIKVSNTSIKTAKIQSTVTLASHATYSVGPFTNTGPVPPKANTKTTYTVTWLLNNSTNAITDATVQANLPSYVHWLGKISPATEDVTWNSDQNAVVWHVGALPVNNTGSKKQISFQIELDTTSSQISSAPILANNINFTGTDSNTGAQISVTSPDLTTKISSDPNHAKESGYVEN